MNEERTREREGGAWIGQHPDENTEQVRNELDQGDERVAATSSESSGAHAPDDRPHGHREGDRAGDDDVRRAGESH
ncbi:MAG: hypothetical protein ACRDGV_08710 [Candidatus Limnocylindria bacterium]